MSRPTPRWFHTGPLGAAIAVVFVLALLALAVLR